MPISREETDKICDAAGDGDLEKLQEFRRPHRVLMSHDKHQLGS